MQNFRNLKVWQKAHDLALLVYRLTADFPREETFGLRHSLRKTAVDIPALIAEGQQKAVIMNLLPQLDPLSGFPHVWNITA